MLSFNIKGDINKVVNEMKLWWIKCEIRLDGQDKHFKSRGWRMMKKMKKK